MGGLYPLRVTIQDKSAGGATIAEAAELTGLSAHTLRYYEDEKLLIEGVPRAANGHRRYSERELGWIDLVSRLRVTGMPIQAIRDYADLVRQGEGNEVERLELLRLHRERVQAQVIEAETHLSAIDHKIRIYESRNQSRTT